MAFTKNLSGCQLLHQFYEQSLFVLQQPYSSLHANFPEVEHYKFMVRMVEHTAHPSQKGTGGGLGLWKVSELVKGRASCHITLLNIYTNGSLTQSKICSVCS